jgi:hypothetical protein
MGSPSMIRSSPSSGRRCASAVGWPADRRWWTHEGDTTRASERDRSDLLFVSARTVWPSRLEWIGAYRPTTMHAAGRSTMIDGDSIYITTCRRPRTGRGRHISTMIIPSLRAVPLLVDAGIIPGRLLLLVIAVAPTRAAVAAGAVHQGPPSPSSR